jgi:hypothetical protein
LKEDGSEAGIHILRGHHHRVCGLRSSSSSKMAYRSPPLQPQPNSYETSDIKYPPPPGPHSQPQNIPHMPDLDRQRPREHSNAQPDAYSESKQYSNARQPINDAVTSAFSTTDNTSVISPELLNAITANVIKELQASNLTAAPPPPQTQHSSAGMATSPSTIGSPPTEHRQVYTPPSPHRASEEAAQIFSSPTQSQAKPVAKHTQGENSSDQRPISPQSQASQADDSDAREDRPSRPRGPKRLSTSADPSILEKIWGTLFDEQGQATPRLGQFLRGIAVHLIEDYEPKYTLVITPEKMQKYYENTKLSNELYPWQIVFDDRTSSISRLYREVEAQHHLVQEKLDERPDTPGLTPIGFERWATLLLLAHPDLEFARLQRTALDMPISNPDDKKERFPKEISRRLFPAHEDTTIVAKIQRAMVTNCNISITPMQNNVSGPDHRPSRTDYRPAEAAQTSPTYPPPPSKNAQDPIVTPTSRTHATALAEREPNPYSNTSSEATVDSTNDEDDLPTPQPIERERKPYVAQPGGGKTYDHTELEKVMSNSSQPTTMDGSRLTRSSSIASSDRPPDWNKSRPIPITVHQRGPPNAMENGPMSADAGSTRHRRSNSIYNRDRPGTRARSPSAGKTDYGHRSEDFGSSHKSTTSTDLRNRDDPEAQARRYRDYERERERLVNDRFDAARIAAYDPRDREREHEPRQRFQSTVGLEAGRGHYLSDEEYYRAMGGVMGDRGAGHSVPQRSETFGRDGYSREAYPPQSYR